MDCSLKILEAHEFLSFLAVCDWLDEKACSKLLQQICVAFVSDWLEYLIHIHRNHRVFSHFRLSVDE